MPNWFYNNITTKLCHPATATMFFGCCNYDRKCDSFREKGVEIPKTFYDFDEKNIFFKDNNLDCNKTNDPP